MKKFWLLVALILFFCPLVLADSVDYQGAGTIAGGTAFTKGMISVGHFWQVGDQLTLIKNLTTGTIQSGNLGILDIKTGTLFSCASGLCFHGGSLDIDNLQNHDLFLGKLSSGSIITSHGTTILSAILSNGATTVIKLKGGQFSSQAAIHTPAVIPEPGGLALLGTGLLALGLVRFRT